MYCGHNKMALSSQQLIAGALNDLLEEQPYNSISVSAICRRAKISRQTFYSLFQSKDNVIMYSLRITCGCRRLPEEEQGDPLRRISGFFSEYLVVHKPVLRVLAENQLMPLLKNLLQEEFRFFACLTEGDRQMAGPYLTSYLAAGIVSIAETYVAGGCRETREELDGIIRLLLGGELYRNE